ncbi:unnamed protein product, partial [Symbiodinium sp. CCMP2592]
VPFFWKISFCAEDRDDLWLFPSWLHHLLAPESPDRCTIQRQSVHVPPAWVQGVLRGPGVGPSKSIRIARPSVVAFGNIVLQLLSAFLCD